MKKGSLAVLLLLMLAPCTGFGQEPPAETFVPFVSKLKARADESQILLSWRNPTNMRGSVLLYRHTEEIDKENFSRATLLGRVEAPAESFSDTPSDFSPYFYAALVEDPEGRVRDLFIPFRNKTSISVNITAMPSVEELAARISNIEATVVGDSVQLRYSLSDRSRSLLLFRATVPMRDTEDLLKANAPWQLDGGTEQFTDFPIPGLESYYAVVDTEMFKLGKQRVVPGENATETAVIVPPEVTRAALPAQPSRPPAAAAPPDALSATALPYLQLAGESGVARPRSSLDPETQSAVSRILETAPALDADRNTLMILPEDRNEPPPGESLGLYNILQDHLLAGEYTTAESKLQGFLNLRRSPYTEARVRFYLAQAYYFQGLYQEAVLEFVLAQDQLYAPVQPWLHSCFRRIWGGSSLSPRG